MTFGGHHALRSTSGRAPRLQLQRSSARGRLVNRQDDLDCLAAFAAIDQWPTLALDRLDEVRELPGVADMRDRRRVARAARSPGLLCEPRPDVLVLGRLGVELPAQQVVLFDDDAALVPMHGDG